MQAADSGSYRKQADQRAAKPSGSADILRDTKVVWVFVVVGVAGCSFFLV